MIIPNSDVILLKSPLELNQSHQINFRNANEQYNYFYNLPKRIVGTDFTYQRKDSIIRIDELADDLYQYNYVMYRNDNYSNKWFYAFIESIEYVNDNCTFVKIKTDVFQTWQFDLTYKQTFVEREHVNNDTVGANTIRENLETGEYQIVDLRDIPMATGDNNWYICFCVTALPEGCDRAVNGRVKGDNGRIGGVFNSLKFFAVNTFTAAQKIIEDYEQGSVLTDAIINIYMVPAFCVNTDITAPTIDRNGHVMNPLNNYSNTEDFTLQQPIVLAGGYTPRNNKLYCAPFSYIYMSNNAGQEIQLNWEDFPLQRIGNYTMPTMTYYKYYVPSASLSAKIIFSNYKNYFSDETTATQMVNYGISFAKVPVCAWTTDYYTNWLTQNGVNVQTNIGMSIGNALVGTATGALTGGVVGALAGGVAGTMGAINAIGSSMAQMHQAQTIPPQAHGDYNTGDLVYALKRNSISCYYMSIRPEMARIIDKYFDKFGYKVNAVKVPNITGRYNWNYVKTIECYIEADIPQTDLQEIKNMFDNGLTIWHHPNTFMDYSQSNAIVA